MKEGLTFDDILLVPKKSFIKSRLDPVTHIDFLGLGYRSPFIASPMNSIVDANFAQDLMKAGWVGVIHRFQPVSDQYNTIPEKDICLHWFAIETGSQGFKRAITLHKIGARRFLIDTANGHSVLVEDLVKRLKDKFNAPLYIIAGNIATGEAAEDLQRWGVDALRVGIGGGSACITRIVTGCGVPNLTAIQWVREATTLPIIIDGGIRSSGDIVKSLVFGADMVMLGYLLAPFSPAGRIVTHGTTKVKIFEGQASRIFQEEVREGLKKGTAPEGVEHYLPMRYDMTASEFLTELEGGLRSGMVYLNAKSLREIQAQAIKITPASVIESYPRI